MVVHLLLQNVHSVVASVKNIFTKHYGQERLSNLALICIGRYYSNMVLREDMEKVIDKFASSHNRAQYTF